MRISARSLVGFLAHERGGAGHAFGAPRATVMALAPAITWSLVRIRPFWLSTIPVPVSVPCDAVGLDRHDACGVALVDLGGGRFGGRGDLAARS